MQLDMFAEDFVSNETLEGDLYLCNKCNVYKPESAYSEYAFSTFNGARAGGSAACCRQCRSEYDKGKYIALKNAPPKPMKPTPCDCCGNIIAPQNIQFDHDHVTNMFRGWLCKECNTGLGKLGDNIEGLEKGIAYLKRTSNER